MKASRRQIKEMLKMASSLFLILPVCNLNTVILPDSEAEPSVEGDQVVIKCGASQHEDFDLPALALPFLLYQSPSAIPVWRVSDIPVLSATPSYGFSVKPSEKPPPV